MSASTTPTLQEEDEADPVEHTYQVFIKPPLPGNRRLVILQHPNTQSDDPDRLEVPPITGMRLKPASGMLEADVPIDYNSSYDRHKGVVWGSALAKSAAAKTSLGLAGGFGVGGAPARTRGRQQADDNVEGGDWAEAVRQDKVYRVQTLGGLSTEPSDARYLVAVFQGSKSSPSLFPPLLPPPSPQATDTFPVGLENVHLTPVTSLAHLRPQLHHIDASAEQDRISRATAGAGGAGNAASQKDAPAPRAIHMTIKSSTDGDDAATETMADRLRGVQLEPWKRIDFADEERDDSWATFQRSLLLRTEDGAGAEAKEETKYKGKKPAVGTKEEEDGGEEDLVVAGREGNAGAPDLRERVHGLGTDWGEDELLRAVSGIKADDKKPGEEAVTDRVDRRSSNAKASSVKKEPGVKAEPGKSPRKPAAPRSGRTKGTAMEID